MANRTRDEILAELADYAGAANARNTLMARRALGEAVSKFNRRGIWWFMFHVTDSADDTELADGTREYEEPDDFSVHVASVMLNEDATRVSSTVRCVAEEEFFRLWWQTTDAEGRPWVFTRVRETGKLLFNRDPGPGYDGRKVRHAFFRQLSMPDAAESFEIPDTAEDYLFQEALWRLKRYGRVPGGYDRDKQIASDTEKELLAARPSIDLTALGFSR